MTWCPFHAGCMPGIGRWPKTVWTQRPGSANRNHSNVSATVRRMRQIRLSGALIPKTTIATASFIHTFGPKRRAKRSCSSLIRCSRSVDRIGSLRQRYRPRAEKRANPAHAPEYCAARNLEYLREKISVEEGAPANVLAGVFQSLTFFVFLRVLRG